MRLPWPPLLELDAKQHRIHLLADPGAIYVLRPEAECDVLEYGEVWEESVVLRQIPNLPLPRGERDRGLVIEPGLIGDGYMAVIGSGQAGEQTEHGGLASSSLSHQSERAAGLDFDRGRQRQSTEVLNQPGADHEARQAQTERPGQPREW